MLRIIREIKPSFIVGENVPGIISLALDQVLSDLEAEGYTTETFIIPAVAINAPHRRDRVWIIAYSDSRTERTTGSSHITGIEGGAALQEEDKGWQGSPVLPNGCPHLPGITSNTQSTGQQGRINRPGKKQFWGSDTRVIPFQSEWDFTQPGVCGRNDGIPHRVHRIKALGNAIVPQVAYEIFGIIEQLIIDDKKNKTTLKK